MTATERRLSWRSIGPLRAALMEQMHGRGVWPRLTPEQWARLPWQSTPTAVTFTGNDRMDQYRMLLRWAESHEQPIRDVKLEERQPSEWTEVSHGPAEFVER